MAFNSEAGKATYTASAGQTAFPFLFKIYVASDLKVYQTPSGSTPDDTADLLILTTDYTVTINGDAGGEVTLVAGATLNDTIVVKRDLPITRDTEYQTSGDLLAETLNEDQNYQTYLTLDSQTTSDRLLKLPDTDVNMSSSLPTSIANYALFVNAAGTALEYRVGDEIGAALKAWEAEAEAMTSESYAIQVEDTFVDEYSSDGDGSFTATATVNYSALHWAAKAATFNPSLYALVADFESGTYTPTVISTVNVDSTTPQIIRYSKVGSIVSVGGTIVVDPTSATTPTTVLLSIPIATDLTSILECSGILAHYGTESIVGTIKANTLNDAAELSFETAVITSTISITFTFTYEI